MIKFEKTEVVGLEPAIRGMRNPLNSWAKSDSGICKGGDDGIGCTNCSDEDRCQHSFDKEFKVGKNDHDLMTRLRNSGTDHRKYLRMIVVYVDITAPLYWWKEFDTYKVGTVANSCSTMHKIQEKEFTLDDFSHEHLLGPEDQIAVKDRTELSIQKDEALSAIDINGAVVYYGPKQFMQMTCNVLNRYRDLYLKTKDKKYWWQMIQLLPSSYNQKRTVMMSYEVLANIFKPTSRRNHKLDEWRLSGNNLMNEKLFDSFCDWVVSLPYSELITGEFDKED